MKKLSIMSKKEAEKFCQKMMFDSSKQKLNPEDCILFGKAYNQLIGVHTNERRTHPLNANQLVIGSKKSGKTYNFLTSNLLNGTSSAIVFSAFDTFERYNSFFEARNIKVHRISFNKNFPSCRYNPFLHMEKTESNAVKMASYLEKLFCDSVYDSAYADARKIILEMAVLYVLMGTLEDEERTFRTMLKALKEMSDIINKADSQVPTDKVSELVKYDPTQSKAWFKQLEKLEISIVKAVFPSLLTDYQIFVSDSFAQVFEEEAGIETVPVEDFYHNQHYLFFITSPATSFFFKPISLLIELMSDRLFRYAETSLKMELPKHIQFYLDDFQLLDISNFIAKNSICRKYNLNWTLLIDTVESLKTKWTNDEWLSVVCCDSAVVFLDINSDETEKFAKQLFTGNGTYDEDVYERNLLFSELLSTAVSNMKKQQISSGNSWIVCLNDHAPIICDKLNPVDFMQ